MEQGTQWPGENLELNPVGGGRNPVAGEGSLVALGRNLVAWGESRELNPVGGGRNPVAEKKNLVAEGKWLEEVTCTFFIEGY